MRPALEAWVEGHPVARVECPARLAPRDWLLGVVAVQCEGPSARLRANLTGWPVPVVVPLPARAIVHVAFGSGDLPDVPPPEGVGLVVYASGRERARTVQAPGRAFGHVYCRYLRSGVDEAGFDLTPFLDVPEGTKYERLVSEPIAPGTVVSFALSLE